MAINKKLIHFKTFANFNSKKLSANEANTQYTLGVNGTVTTGDPEILYQSVCWIKDTKQQWTHGQLYDLSGGASGEENVQSDWFENSLTDAYIKNRTHYITGTKITSAGTYTVTSPVIYYNKNLYTLEVGVKTTLQTGPPIYATLLSSTSLKIEDSSNYLSGTPLFINAVVSKLSDIYIPDNIVRNDSLKTINGESIVGSGDLVIEDDTYFFNWNGLESGTITQDQWDALQSADKILIKNNGTIFTPQTVVKIENIITLDLIVNALPLMNLSITINRDLSYQAAFQEYTYIESGGLKTINGNSLEGSGNITIEVQDAVTESVVSGWGFTKNTGTITEVKANGTSISTSGVANIPAASTSAYGVTKLSSSTSSTSTTLAATASAVKAAYDLANGKQSKLTSGTNIMTARGQSILTSGDLFDPVIITTNYAGTPQQTTVGKCYVYTVPQTTAKTFVLNVPNNIWNDSINIIIKTSESITFQSSNALPIMWANGTTPTFDSDKVYEISFRYTPMGWLGVAVAFYSA